MGLPVETPRYPVTVRALGYKNDGRFDRFRDARRVLGRRHDDDQAEGDQGPANRGYRRARVAVRRGGKTRSLPDPLHLL